MLEMSDDRFHDPAEHAATLAALSPYPFFGVRGQAERIFLFREGRSTEGFPNLFMGFILRRRTTFTATSVSMLKAWFSPTGT